MSRRVGAAGALRGASQRTIGILAAIGSATAWGLGATTSDYVLTSGMGNDTFLVLELSVGFVVLMVIGALRGQLGGFHHPGLTRAAATGLIEPWGAYTLGNIGIIFSSGAFVALVSSLNPVLVALLALPFLGERVSGTAAALMVVSIGGVGLVIGGDAFGGSLNPLGILFSVLGLFCGATYALVSSSWYARFPSSHSSRRNSLLQRSPPPRSLPFALEFSAVIQGFQRSSPSGPWRSPLASSVAPRHSSSSLRPPSASQPPPHHSSAHSSP